MTACVTEINAYLESYVRGLDLPPALIDAIGYALLGGGKRIRPILAWHACEAAGGEGPDALPACAAVELIHAFSLVHDDLPAMDDDDLRRGKPTLHIQHGEAMAILAGDAMLTLAFGVVQERLSPATASVVLGELTHGTEAMISGQVYDTLGGLPETMDVRERLACIHRNKTGALIRTACRAGGLCAGLAPETASGTMETLTRYAEAIGLMFQIVDDVLDVEQTSEHAGKRTGKDSEAGKLTYPGVLGLKESKAEIERLASEAAGAARSLGERAAPLATLSEYLARRTK